MPKRGINDPYGEAVLANLDQLGFDYTERVRIGKCIRIDVDAENEDAARATGEEMCKQLLVNPIVEDYEIVVRNADAG